jgi:hypothetical protein
MPALATRAGGEAVSVPDCPARHSRAGRNPALDSRLRGNNQFLDGTPRFDDFYSATNSFSRSPISPSPPRLENELLTFAPRPKSLAHRRFRQLPFNSFSRSREPPTHPHARERVCRFECAIVPASSGGDRFTPPSNSPVAHLVTRSGVARMAMERRTRGRSSMRSECASSSSKSRCRFCSA